MDATQVLNEQLSRNGLSLQKESKSQVLACLWFSLLPRKPARVQQCTHAQIMHRSKRARRNVQQPFIVESVYAPPILGAVQAWAISHCRKVKSPRLRRPTTPGGASSFFSAASSRVLPIPKHCTRELLEEAALASGVLGRAWLLPAAGVVGSACNEQIPTHDKPLLVYLLTPRNELYSSCQCCCCY